jgi:single-strand DNA-binding protein
MSINNISISGRLTRDPEVSETGSGKSVAKFSIATDRAGTEDVGYFEVQAWDKLATEIVGKYLKKGTKIAVSGALRQERFKNKEDMPQSRVIIVARDLEMMSGGTETSPTPETKKEDEYDPFADE